jgi:exodeoxyribonuclease VII large subunit
LVKESQELLIETRRRLAEQAGRQLTERQHAWQSLDSRLRLLGPEQVLARGYSITMDAQTGKVLRNASEVQRGQRLRTRLKTGEISSKAEP